MKVERGSVGIVEQALAEPGAGVEEWEEARSSTAGGSRK